MDSARARAAAVEVADAPADGGDAQWCLAQYYAELRERFAADVEAAVGAARPADFMPPRGWFFVARHDGRIVGCGGLRRVDPQLAEVKRMWVDRAARGHGIGGRLLDAIEARARDAGIRTLRLDTNASLTEAIAMYSRRGYRDVPAFNEEPYAHRWFAKDLTTG
ncbi:MAG TPA: GNAT family N-acetyltransferase [Candidatus Sulfotelmatobacter sp.]|nr:GNAT family N-acetyltransferase [Candidatus Sulfotelmatobacter sp.]